MLFLDGIYLDRANGSGTRFRWVKASTSEELGQLVHIAQRISRFMYRQGLLERDAVNSDEKNANGVIRYDVFDSHNPFFTS